MPPFPASRVIANAAALGLTRAVFKPMNIPGCVLWLDVGQLAVVADGVTVPTFTDFSGNGKILTQGTDSKRPTYLANQQNGRPVLRYDGVDDHHSDVTTGAIFNATTPDSTVFFVTKFLSTGTNKTVGTMDHWVYGIATANNMRLTDGGVGGICSYAYSDTTNYHIFVFTTSMSGATVSGEIFQDGVSKTTGSATDSSVRTGQGICTETAGSSSVDGQNDVAEVIAYNVLLDNGSRRRVEAYLSAKYAIAVT